VFLFSIFKVVSLFPLSTFYGKTCNRRRRRGGGDAVANKNYHFPPTTIVPVLAHG